MPYLCDKAGKFEAAIIAYFAKKKARERGRVLWLCYILEKRNRCYFIRKANPAAHKCTSSQPAPSCCPVFPEISIN